jgi:hypothetical protein
MLQIQGVDVLQRAEELQVLRHGQLGEERVVLRAHAQRVTNLAQVLRQGQATHEGVA